MPQMRVITKLDWSIAWQLRNATHSCARFAYENELGAISFGEIYYCRFTRTHLGSPCESFLYHIQDAPQRTTRSMCHQQSKFDKNSEEMDSNVQHPWFLSKWSYTCNTSFISSISFIIYMTEVNYIEHPVYVWPCRWWTVLRNILRSQLYKELCSRTRKGASPSKETRHFLVSTPDCGKSSDFM